MFHCNTRHSYDLNGLKSKFIACRIDQVFLVMSFGCAGLLHENKKKFWKTLIWSENDVIITSSWRHHGVYPIEINLLIMLYLTSKFHVNRINTFGFMERRGGGAFETRSPQAH